MKTTTVQLVSQAAILVHDAIATTPLRSNLRDELENLAEQLDRVQSMIAENKYDEVGMER